jgi:hypothetical protein
MDLPRRRATCRPPSPGEICCSATPTGPQSSLWISFTPCWDWRGGDTGSVDPPADPAASSLDLFFPLVVFMLLDGEGFILQVQRVFTRIRSGAAVVATGGGALGSTISTEVAVCTGGGFFARSSMNGCKCEGRKTLRVLASIYKSTGGSATAGWICFNTADSAVAPDLSTFSSRCTVSRGLGYI